MPWRKQNAFKVKPGPDLSIKHIALITNSLMCESQSGLRLNGVKSWGPTTFFFQVVPHCLLQYSWDL